MDVKGTNKGVQIICPICKDSFPVRVQELTGKIRLSVRCPHCKRISEVVLQDIK